MRHAAWLLLVLALSCTNCGRREAGVSGKEPGVPGMDRVLEDLLTGVRAVEVEVGERAWIVVEDRGTATRAAVLAALPDRVAWGVVASTRFFAGLELVGDTAWVAGGHASVTIVQYDEQGFDLRALPPARYSDASGVMGQSERYKMLKPHRYVEGIAANEAYLWAWFTGGMIMMTELEGQVDWQPHRYAAQLDTDGEPCHFFFPKAGWARGNLLICTAAPESGWPVRICVLSADRPGKGRRLQPPPESAGYTIRVATVAGDRVWALGENEGRVPDFGGPRWCLFTVSLPDFTWHEQRLPRRFQDWEARGEPQMTVDGDTVAVGSQLGASGESDLVLIHLGQPGLHGLEWGAGKPSQVNCLRLKDGTLWVAHDQGVARVHIRPGDQ